MIEGYVLHAISYKDTSLIVKFFTKQQGIVSLIAHGAKRYKSPFFGILQPFIPLSLYWKHHNQDLAILHKAEVHATPSRLWGNYLFGALYINELLIRLLAFHDPNVELFDCYQGFLQVLNNASKTLKLSNNYDSLLLQQNLRMVEKKILKAIGYELQLNIESNTGAKISAAELYYFDINYGIRRYVITEKILPKILISGSSLLALHSNIFMDQLQAQQAKLFMRSILGHFLGDVPVAARNLFC